jgi:hypothetical protein
MYPFTISLVPQFDGTARGIQVTDYTTSLLGFADLGTLSCHHRLPPQAIGIRRLPQFTHSPADVKSHTASGPRVMNRSIHCRTPIHST